MRVSILLLCSLDDLTEELLVLHEEELERMREYYEENKVLLEKIARRQSLWTEFLDREVRIKCIASLSVKVASLNVVTKLHRRPCYLNLMASRYSIQRYHCIFVHMLSTLANLHDHVTLISSIGRRSGSRSIFMLEVPTNCSSFDGRYFCAADPRTPGTVDFLCVFCSLCLVNA